VKAPVGGGGASARKKRSAAGVRGRENSGPSAGVRGLETAVGGGGAGARKHSSAAGARGLETAVGGRCAEARKQRSAAGARVRENSGRRRGCGGAKTAVRQRVCVPQIVHYRHTRDGELTVLL